MNHLFQIMLWVLFFASSIYGHVAFKLVADKQTILQVIFSLWGMTALLAWGVSALLWIMILGENPLITASSVSALRYVLIILAAMLCLHETITIEQGAGIAFIMVGVYLVK